MNYRVLLWCAAFYCLGMLLADSTRPPYPIVERAGVIVLKNDPGGGVDDHVKWYGRIGSAHMPVRIEGWCNSSCTFVLKLPAEQICMTPGSVLGFHQAFDQKTGKNMPELTALLVRTQYPKPVRDWIKKNGPLKSEPIYMKAATAIKLGVVRAC